MYTAGIQQYCLLVWGHPEQIASHFSGQAVPLLGRFAPCDFRYMSPDKKRILQK